jgi:hypothetical protein
MRQVIPFVVICICRLVYIQGTVGKSNSKPTQNKTTVSLTHLGKVKVVETILLQARMMHCLE